MITILKQEIQPPPTALQKQGFFIRFIQGKKIFAYNHFYLYVCRVFLRKYHAILRRAYFKNRKPYLTNEGKNEAKI